jgi:hypothetical protein
MPQHVRSNFRMHPIAWCESEVGEQQDEGEEEETIARRNVRVVDLAPLSLLGSGSDWRPHSGGRVDYIIIQALALSRHSSMLSSSILVLFEALVKRTRATG